MDACSLGVHVDAVHQTQQGRGRHAAAVRPVTTITVAACRYWAQVGDVSESAQPAPAGVRRRRHGRLDPVDDRLAVHQSAAARRHPAARHRQRPRAHPQLGRGQSLSQSNVVIGHSIPGPCCANLLKWGLAPSHQTRQNSPVCVVSGVAV